MRTISKILTLGLLVSGCYSVEEAKSPTIVEFKTDKASVTAEGTVVFSWQVTDASTVKIDTAAGQVVMPADSRPSGTFTSAPISANTTFVLTAVNAGKTATRNVQVTVDVPVDPPVIEFTADKPSVRPMGQVVLTYRVTNAENVQIDIAGGAVVLPQTTSLEGNITAPPISVATTYVLKATNKGVVASKNVTVMVEDVPRLHAVINRFSATPASVAAGAAVMIHWETVNATEGKLVTAEGMTVLTIAASELPSGNFTVNPMATTTYELKIKGTDLQEVVLSTAVSIEDMPGTAQTARQLFDRTVAPIFTMACASCHAGNLPANGPDFLGAGPANYYTSITADPRFLSAPEQSILVLKGEHTGPALTPPQKNAVNAWLLKEVMERGLNTMTPPMMGTGNFQPRTLQEAITRFGACMTRADWDATYGQNNDTQIARQNSVGAAGGQGGGPCYACHATGQAGAFLSQVSGDTFDQNRLSPFVLKLVLGTVNTDGSFKDLTPANRFRDKGTDAGHPAYVLTPARQQAIDEFVNRTLRKFRDYTRACP